MGAASGKARTAIRNGIDEIAFRCQMGRNPGSHMAIRMIRARALTEARFPRIGGGHSGFATTHGAIAGFMFATATMILRGPMAGCGRIFGCDSGNQNRLGLDIGVDRRALGLPLGRGEIMKIEGDKRIQESPQQGPDPHQLYGRKRQATAIYCDALTHLRNLRKSGSLGMGNIRGQNLQTSAKPGRARFRKKN
jgi:hypothetical protein